MRIGWIIWRRVGIKSDHWSLCRSLILLFITLAEITSGSNARSHKHHSHHNTIRQLRSHLHRKHKYHQSNNVKLDPMYSNSWAVHIDPPHGHVAKRIAKKHGFHVVGKIGNLQGHFHFKHNDVLGTGKNKAKEKTDLLVLEKEVQWAQQQEILDRTKRDGVPTDPLFNQMWYLLNTGQATGPAGVDINVAPVWKSNITGKGVVIAVLDDGVDRTHPDLIGNFDANASYDFNDNDEDPMPRDSDPDNCHGTRCAGEAAATANNNECGVGVAYNAKIGGVRMLDGQATDILEANALGFKYDYIDIYINCWGPKDDGKTFGKPGPVASKALMEGALKGRNRLGSIFIWATGNGGLTDDDCNCDGYTTSIYTISIGCIGDHGLSAYYTEKCSSTLAVTFNGAAHKEGKENKMITTDLYHQCTEEFKGTSASAPLAAGVVALTLEANPRLSWRDIQHIIVNTAQITSPVDEGWVKNGAGFHFNHKFGFGRLDAEAMVNTAKGWVTVPTQRKCTAASSIEPLDIPRNDNLLVDVTTTACATNAAARITKLEHVVLTISFVHRRRGDVSIDLFSPAGTRSQMLSTRKYDESDEGLDEWNFMTVHKWGENPHGVWKLKVTDNANVDQGDYLGQAENDVEDLEEQVIDTQTKLQKEKWEALKQKDPNFDAPYPPGVRRDSVGLNGEAAGSPYPSSYYTSPNAEYGRSDIEEPEDEDAYVESVGDENEKVEARSRISPKDLYTATKQTDTPRPFNFKKVQVTEEETGTQRVQVNAGYENSRITCVSGYDTCAGVLLKYVLTIYGTGD